MWMGVEGLVDGLKVAPFVFGPVFYQVVYAHLDHILKDHPYDIVDPYQAD